MVARSEMVVVSPPASLESVSHGLHDDGNDFSQVISQMIHHIIFTYILALLHLPSNPGQEISSIRYILRSVVAYQFSFGELKFLRISNASCDVGKAPHLNDRNNRIGNIRRQLCN